MSRMPSIEVNGLVPWMSQVISLNTVRNVLSVTNRTPGFDQPPGQEAALAEPRHPVAVADFFGFLGEIERFAGLGAGDQAKRGLEIAVQKLGVLALLERRDGAIDDLAELSPAVDAGFADALRRQEVRAL